MDITTIYSFLPPDMRKNIKLFPEAVSTNSLLKTAAHHEEDGTVYLALRQSGGRGRLGRSFFSPPGGIYLSVLMRPREGLVSTVTARAALAVSDAVGEVCGIRPGIKWVNDLILDGRKLGGILVEGIASRGKITHAVIGVGLNVNTERFDGETADIATSLLFSLGERVDRAHLAAALIRRLRELCEFWPKGSEEALREYRSRCVTLGREVSFTRDGVTARGVAEDIDADFALTVRTQDGKRERISFGEVSVLPYGLYYTRK